MSCFVSQRERGLHLAAVLAFLALLIPTTTANPSFSSKRVKKIGPWGMKSYRISSDSPLMSHWQMLQALRAGATVEEEVHVDSDEDIEEVEVDIDEDTVDSVDAETDDEVPDDEVEDSSSDEEEYESALEEEETSITIGEYDIQLAPPPGLQIGALLGVMLLSRRLDMFSPKVVRFARFIFIFYIIAQLAFLVYVRIQAKLNNDRTEIEMKSPLSGLVSSQLGQNQDMVKDLASQFLSTRTTIMEYDLKQAKAMNSGLLINMAFMWFLHFKMDQTQPLLAQTVTGMLNLVYSPLFQVYMMGRNLERPFKNPATKGLEALAGKESEAAIEEDEVEIDVEVDEIDVESSEEEESYEDEDESENEDEPDDTNEDPDVDNEEEEE